MNTLRIADFFVDVKWEEFISTIINLMLITIVDNTHFLTGLATPKYRCILSIMLLGVFFLAGCSHPSRAPELSQHREKNGEYRYQVFKERTERGKNNTFFAATFSGGGMRATALAYGALKALANTEAYVPKTSTVPSKLINEFDVVSAVSGGSVTAAYWALYGADSLHNLKDLFLLENVQGQLLASAFHPASLLSLPTPYYSRIDTLSRYFERTLFGETTYGDLIERENRPYLVINATDIATGWLFPFIQPQFDLLCADLNGFKLADAVAASTAYPVVFPSLTLENHRSPLSSLTGNGQKLRKPTCPQKELEQDLTNNLKTMDNAVSKAQNELGKAVEDVQRLELEVTKVRAEIAILVKKEFDAKAKVDTLETKLVDAKGEVQELESEHKEIEAQVQILMGELTNANKEVRTLESERDTKKKEMEDIENKIKATRGDVRKFELHNPTFVSVMQWWIWVGNEHETETKEVFEQAHKLAIAQNRVKTLEKELEDTDSVKREGVNADELEVELECAREHTDSVKREGVNADELEVELECAREQLRTLETELIPFIEEQWLKWKAKHDPDDISNLEQNGINQAASEIRASNTDTQGEGQGQVRSRDDIKWSQWMLQLIEGQDELDALDTEESNWLGKWIKKFWDSLEIEEKLAKLRKAYEVLRSKFSMAKLDKQKAELKLEETKRNLTELKLELQEAEVTEEMTSQMLKEAVNNRDEINAELEEAEMMEKHKEEILQRHLRQKRDLEMYLQRVKSIQTEHEKAARNYKKQISHYGEKDAHFVHLSDGGVTDNLGFTFLLELLEDFEKRDKREIERVVILIVDARTGPSNRYASRRSAPNPIDVIRTTTGTAIDSKSFLLARELERVTKELQDTGVIKERYIVNVGFDWIAAYDNQLQFSKDNYDRGHGDSGAESHDSDGGSDSSRGATDSLNDNLKDCQRGFQEIPTNWNLPEEDIEALIDIGEVLVRESEGFKDLLKEFRGEISPSEKTISTVCTRNVNSSMSREETSSSAVADRDR